MGKPAALKPITAALSSALLVMVTAGCGDTGEAESSSNRGSGSSLTEDTSVENAFIVPTFLPGRCAIQYGAGAKMRFTVTNASSSETERLLGVSTDVADDAIVADGVIAVRSTVGFGQPSAAPVDTGGQRSAANLIGLNPGLRPAMTAAVTFHFDRAGDISMLVPVEACPTQDR